MQIIVINVLSSLPSVRGWRDSSTLKTTYGSYRGPRFATYIHSGSQSSVIPVSGETTPSPNHQEH